MKKSMEIVIKYSDKIEAGNLHGNTKNKLFKEMKKELEAASVSTKRAHGIAWRVIHGSMSI